MWYVDVIKDGSYVESEECYTRKAAMKIAADLRKIYPEDEYIITITYDDVD
jgi:hypothetical protein